MMTAPHIRSYEPSDYENYTRLRCALYDDDAPEQIRQEFNDLLRDPDHNGIFVLDAPAQAGGMLGGFIELSIRPNAIGCSTRPVAYIESWYVRPDLRRQGWGSRLAECGEQWARSKGCLEIASDCDVANAISNSAHGAVGFSEVARIVCFRKVL